MKTLVTLVTVFMFSSAWSAYGNEQPNVVFFGGSPTVCLFPTNPPAQSRMQCQDTSIRIIDATRSLQLNCTIKAMDINYYEQDTPDGKVWPISNKTALFKCLKASLAVPGLSQSASYETPRFVIPPGLPAGKFHGLAIWLYDTQTGMVSFCVVDSFTISRELACFETSP